MNPPPVGHRQPFAKDHMTNETTPAAAPEAPPKRRRKSLAQTLQDHHYGHTAAEADEKLWEAIDAAERTGKATQVTLTIKLRPAGKAGRYDVTMETTNKLPPKEIEAAVMFVGPDGNLQNNDPRQRELDGMRVVDGGSPMRVAATADQPAVRVS
jgi:hypothetical protein